MQTICRLFNLASSLRLSWGFCLFAVLGAGTAMADEWPKLIIPEGTKAVIVADQIDINRMPTRIWQFHSNKTPEQFLAFYRGKWINAPAKGAPPYIENSTEDWKIISRPEGDFMIAVQVDAKNPLASNGMVSIAQLKGNRVDRALVSGLPEYPKMPGSTVLQELTNHDPGKKALTVILENGNSAASNRAYYRKFYEARGWAEIGINNRKLRTNDVLLLQKGPFETSFIFTARNTKTQVVGVIQYPESEQ